MRRTRAHLGAFIRLPLAARLALRTSIGSLRLENSDLSDNGASGLEASVVVGDVVVIDSFLEDNGLELGLYGQSGAAGLSLTLRF